jgi:dienelactone hydrolase
MLDKPLEYLMFIRLLTALLFLSIGQNVRAQVIEEQFNLPVAIRHATAGEVRQEVVVTVFRDSRRPRSPYLVLGHGRAPKPEDRAGMGRARFTANSQYFVSLGFAVFVPTRIGYGVTGGPDLEDTGPCSVKNYPPGYDAAAQLTTQVIAHARRLPYVDQGRGLVVGQSFGGATAITMAARPVEGLMATVNFAGGGGGNPARPAQPCRPDMLRAMFADYGRSARIPTLWLYSENDRYFGVSQPRAWFDAFVAAGGRGSFIQLPANGDDGHSSFTRNPTAWRPHFEAFLQEVGFRNTR